MQNLFIQILIFTNRTVFSVLLWAVSILPIKEVSKNNSEKQEALDLKEQKTQDLKSTDLDTQTHSLGIIEVAEVKTAEGKTVEIESFKKDFSENSIKEKCGEKYEDSKSNKIFGLVRALDKQTLRQKLAEMELKMQNNFTDSKTLHSILILVFWTMASRVLGLLRTLFTARMQTVDTEMFNASFLVADTITTALILGSLSTAIMPNMGKYNAQKKFELLNFYTTFCLIFGFFGIALVAGLGFWQMPWILTFVNQKTIAELSDLGRLDEFVLISRIILLSPVLFSLKTVLGAFLNSKKEFFIYSLDGAVSNLGNILGLSVLYAFFGPTGAICGTVLGVLVACSLFFWDAHRFGFEFGFSQLSIFFSRFGEYWAILKTDIFKSFGVYLARLAVFSQVRMAEVLIIVFSAGISSGQITALRIGMDIQGVFFGVILSIATVFLPNLTDLLHQTKAIEQDGQDSSDKDSTSQGKLPENQGKIHQNFWNQFWKYLKITAGFSLFGTFVTILGTPVLLWLIKVFAFLPADSFLSSTQNLNLTLSFTIISSISLVFQSLAEIFNRYFVATQKIISPLIASLGGNLLAFEIAFLFSQTWGSSWAVIWGFVFNSFLLAFLSGYFVYSDWTRQIFRK